MNETLIAYACAYFIGAIPFGLILARIFGGVNIVKMGSKSIGATNVLRVLKEQDPKKAKIIAIFTVICDALKGLIVLLAASVVGIDTGTLWAMAVLAVLGHCFSPYLMFEGGKGIATGAAVLGFFLPIEIAISLLVWFVVGKVLKISSLASLAALLTMLILSFIIHYDIPEINTHAPLLIIAAVVVYKHAPNIKRLIIGDEKKVI